MSRRTHATIVILYTLLIISAGALRFLTYDRYLPLLDYSDETNMMLLSMHMRGVDEIPIAADYGAHLTGEWLAGYPPLYAWLGIWGQRLTEAAATQFLFPGDYIGAMRLLSVVANILTVTGLLWFGWRLARPLGIIPAAISGWLTALPYALSPQIVDVSNLAIPDSLIPLACIAALVGAVLAIQSERGAWLLLSLLGAIAAIYLKYSLVFTLWLPFVAFVIRLRRHGLRPMLPLITVLALIATLTAGYLIWGYGALDLQNREAQGFRESGLANMLNFDRNRVNLLTALRISTGIPLFIATLLTARFSVRASRPLEAGFRVPDFHIWLWLLIPFIIGNTLLTSSVVYADILRGGYGRIRFMFPAVLALSAIWALLIVHIGITLQRYPQWLPVGIAAALTLLWSIPTQPDNLQLIRAYAKTDTLYLLWQYTDASLPPDGAILTARGSRTHRTWNRPYSGYDGQTPFTWVHSDHPEQKSPEQTFAEGTAYFIYTSYDAVLIYDNDETWAYMDSLYHLKTIPADLPGRTGETVHIRRFLHPETKTDHRFGDAIRLVGYDLSATTHQPGDTLRFRPYWQADQTPAANYSLFVHLYPTGDPAALVAQFDGTPVNAKRLPPTWDDPDERLIGTDVTLTLPNSLPAGTYTLALGLYNFETGARLPVGDQDRIAIPIIIE